LEVVNSIKKFPILEQTIRKYDISGKFIFIETLEKLLADNLTRAKLALSQMKNNNIRISVDDFGTGFSSLFF